MRNVLKSFQEEEIGDTEKHWGELRSFRESIQPGEIRIMDGEIRAEVDAIKQRGDKADKRRHGLGALGRGGGDEEDGFPNNEELP